MTNHFFKKVAKAISLVLICLSVFVACDKDNADFSLSSEHAATNAAINYENADDLFNRFYKANGALEKTREYAKDVYLNSVANGFHVLKESGKEELYEENVRAFTEGMEEFVSKGKEGKSAFFLLTDKVAAEELIAPSLPRKRSIQNSKYKLELVDETGPEEEATRAFFNETYRTPYPSSETQFLIDEDRAFEQLQVPKVSQRASKARAGLRSLMTILYSKTGGKGFTGHMGMIYDDNGNNGRVVLDANEKGSQDGMKEHNIDAWKNEYPIAASMGVSQYSYKYEIKQEVDWLYNTHPKYSIWSWRARKTRRPSYVYCSLVPWIAYKYGLGLDIDYNGGSYVKPWEVYRFFDGNM